MRGNQREHGVIALGQKDAIPIGFVAGQITDSAWQQAVQSGYYPAAVIGIIKPVHQPSTIEVAPIQFNKIVDYDGGIRMRPRQQQGFRHASVFMLA